MNTVSRNKILLSIIAILLVSNIVMLVLLLRINKPHPEIKPGFTERLKKEVGFSPEQMQIFEPKKKAFWASMRKRFEEIKKTKEKFYFQLYRPETTDSVFNSVAEEIGREQKELDLQVFRHFKEVRMLCTPEQLPKFDSLVPYIIQRMTALPQRRK